MAHKKGKAADGSGSIRRRKNGTWEGRYIAGYDSGTGKPIRKSVYGKTQKEVREKLRAITASLDAGTYQAPNRITVEQWLKEWLNVFCLNSIKPHTLAGYESVVRVHLVPQLGALRIQELRLSHVQRMVNGLVEKGLSAKTIKNIVSVLRKALSVAMIQGLVQANVCTLLGTPQALTPEMKPLEDAEIPLFLEECKHSRFGAAYAICLFTGLRRSECLGLSWDNIDFDNERITVCQQLLRHRKYREKGYYYIAPTKSSRNRVIAPPHIAFEYLRAVKIEQTENQLAAGPLWENKWNLVFTNEIGRHYAHTTFYRHFKKIAAAIGRPDARPHDLRHTAATVAISSGADYKSVQQFLGHATASFTLDRYVHSSEKMKNDTASRMQAYYDNQRKHG